MLTFKIYVIPFVVRTVAIESSKRKFKCRSSLDCIDILILTKKNAL